MPYLIAAQKATMDEFADVWHDATKTEMVLSYFLSKGTNTILENDYLIDPASSVLARYLEQHIAVELKQTQALINWPKIVETSYEAEMDMHTLIKFFRRRIPCSCLDGEYQRWNVTKVGFCFNPLCIPPEDVELERSKTKYCSRCRCVAYCCRECQEAHWTSTRLIVTCLPQQRQNLKPSSRITSQHLHIEGSLRYNVLLFHCYTLHNRYTQKLREDI